MKRTGILLAALMLSLAMTACGQKEEANTPTETEVHVETPIAIENETEAPKETAAEKETEAEKTPVDKAEGGYEDNFAVEPEAVVDYANQIKEAVAAQDLEKLADLAGYPLYVGFQGGSVSAASREELIALGTEKIFAPELTASIAEAPTDDLKPSMAGFSLTKSGKPNIVFGVMNGKLAVVGINY